MELNEIKRLVAELPQQERSQIQRYLNELEHPALIPPQRPFTMEAFREAVESMREDLTDEERQELADALDQDYIEPVDEADWNP